MRTNSIMGDNEMIIIMIMTWILQSTKERQHDKNEYREETDGGKKNGRRKTISIIFVSVAGIRLLPGGREGGGQQHFRCVFCMQLA